jgi:thiol:disulfide interchange protein DsbG
MRHMLLTSALFLVPSLASAAPTCTIPPAPQAAAASALVSAEPLAASRPPAATATTVAPVLALRPLAPIAIGQVPALKRIASNGATLMDLGTEHGLRTIFASNGNAFQVFYVAPDGQAVVGGMMWDDTGHNVTRDQVAPIPGTIPTVRIGMDTTPATPMPAMASIPIVSPLKAVTDTTYGTIGSPQAPRLWMFIDPMCAFSVRAMQALEPYVRAGRVQLAVIPLSVLDYEDQGRSTQAAEVMVSELQDQMVAAWTNQQLTGTPSPAAPAVLQRNMAAAAAIQLRGTPTFVWQKADGSVGRSDGLPNDLSAVIASIGH